MAKLAEQAERYEEMVKFMEKFVLGTTPEAELTVEERNLLSIAYKNVIGSLRAAWRIVSSIEQKEDSRKNEDHIILVKDYRSKVENELADVCSGILKILDSNLVPSASTAESKVFYLKMKGDYHRYLAEFKVGDERKETADRKQPVNNLHHRTLPVPRRFKCVGVSSGECVPVCAPVCICSCGCVHIHVPM